MATGVPHYLLGKPQPISWTGFQPCGKNYKGVLLTGMRIDLNADVGEGLIGALAQDPALMPYITSANVACGFHAGGPAVMRATVAVASAHEVAVGTHPGFPDLEGFGRRELNVPPRDVGEFVV